MVDYLNSLDVTPVQAIKIIEKHLVGEPKESVTYQMSSVAGITSDVVDDIWKELALRYGTTQHIAQDIKSQLKKFPVISGKNMGRQLYKLLDICRSAKFNMRRCTELRILNLKDKQKLELNYLIQSRTVGQIKDINIWNSTMINTLLMMTLWSFLVCKRGDI